MSSTTVLEGKSELTLERRRKNRREQNRNAQREYRERKKHGYIPNSNGRRGRPKSKGTYHAVVPGNLISFSEPPLSTVTTEASGPIEQVPAWKEKSTITIGYSESEAESIVIQCADATAQPAMLLDHNESCPIGVELDDKSINAQHNTLSSSSRQLSTAEIGDGNVKMSSLVLLTDSDNTAAKDPINHADPVASMSDGESSGTTNDWREDEDAIEPKPFQLELPVTPLDHTPSFESLSESLNPELDQSPTNFENALEDTEPPLHPFVRPQYYGCNVGQRYQSRSYMLGHWASAHAIESIPPHYYWTPMMVHAPFYLTTVTHQADGRNIAFVMAPQVLNTGHGCS